jgi:hypothetical protein
MDCAIIIKMYMKLSANLQFICLFIYLIDECTRTEFCLVNGHFSPTVVIIDKIFFVKMKSMYQSDSVCWCII